MESTTIIYIVLAVFISVAIAFFQYFYKVKRTPKVHILLFSLKALSLFLIGLLLINPKITTLETENIKPVLSVLVDNSLSTQFFKEEKKVEESLSKIKSNQELQNKFDVQYFSFGNDIKVLDSLSFAETQTNISKAIDAVNELNKGKKAATILITDGNQTQGNDYEFSSTKHKIFPVVIGDTIQYQDIQISQLNVNKYSYVKNKFPVEALLYYEGKETVNTTFSIVKNGNRVFSKRVRFSPENPVQTVTANLVSTTKGVHYYTASISSIANEKNTKNNYKSFSVEVLDEQTKVLLLSSFLHPDLGALKKAIESNKQRKVDIALIQDKNINLEAYQFFVLYQPNSYFKATLEKIPSNFLLVSGTKTDWNFLNSQSLGIQKRAINQKEEYTAIYNADFLTFYQEDIGFGQFPPLQDKFGEVQLKKESQSLLYQKYAGVETTQPLLSTFEENDKKYAVLFGEGIWKWRAASYLQEKNFESFDTFVGNLVQYLASTKKRKRLDVKAQRLYAANEPITISAFYVDKNYQFDSRASLELTVTNLETKAKKSIPFSLFNNSYQVSVEGLASGEYSYTVTVQNQNISSSGRFKIEDYQIEEQFTNANFKKLEQLASKTDGATVYVDKIDDLLKKIQEDASFYTTQKSITKKQSLVDWKWLLLLIVILLSTEWFVRKYYGKI
ncbi:VWA domain-containing protein [Tenacibaculum sp. 1_MG-2023]|uniref:VWA domain-containing protein n=1 Tax=Tenacibaculum sp. 1_MG-2023 TaxID=3062653 RepID=UPI0026E2586A|nr:VWA domain-containing protein [Tenacibaculum sp. 1_MG-2023]MDO6676382.1 VWA domain-containing protein [Tenacibaculum sp. 1_MG-2023]